MHIPARPRLAAIVFGALACAFRPGPDHWRTMTARPPCTGTGATSIQGVLVQELNCNGGYSILGLLGGGGIAIPEPTKPVHRHQRHDGLRGPARPLPPVRAWAPAATPVAPGSSPRFLRLRDRHG